MKIENYIEHKHNKNNSNILDNIPYAVSWSCNGNHYKIENENKIISLVLKDLEHIAVIESPYTISENKAYIINAEKEIIWNISSLFDKEIWLNKWDNMAPIIFIDTYYIKEKLYFFININNTDFRFEFDIPSGKIGKLIESR